MGETTTDRTTDLRTPKPATPTAPGDLPEAVTVFVTRSERTLVLRALRSIDPDRSEALLRALGIARAKGGA